MTRVLSVAMLIITLLAAPLAAQAQPPPGKVYRIGWLHPQPLPKPWLAGFDQGLQEFGYVDGKHIIVERRWGDGNFDRLPAFAADLVRLNVDVLISGNSRALREPVILWAQVWWPAWPGPAATSPVCLSLPPSSVGSGSNCLRKSCRGSLV